MSHFIFYYKVLCYHIDQLSTKTIQTYINLLELIDDDNKFSISHNKFLLMDFQYTRKKAKQIDRISQSK